MNRYVARLKQRDKAGRLLRKIGRHPNLTAAFEFAVEKYGRENVKSVRVVIKND